MKKSLICIIIILFVVGIIGFIQYKNFRQEKLEIAKFNLNYEEYNKDNLNGLDITTVINRAISNNEKNFVEKDKDGLYNLQDENCIEIYVKMIINNTVYRMERINSLGINSFTEYFGEVRFKCAEVTYHENGKIATMTFEAKEY